MLQGHALQGDVIADLGGVPLRTVAQRYEILSWSAIAVAVVLAIAETVPSINDASDRPPQNEGE